MPNKYKNIRLHTRKHHPITGFYPCFAQCYRHSAVSLPKITDSYQVATLRSLCSSRGTWLRHRFFGDRMTAPTHAKSSLTQSLSRSAATSRDLRLTRCSTAMLTISGEGYCHWCAYRAATWLGVKALRLSVNVFYSLLRTSIGHPRRNYAKNSEHDLCQKDAMMRALGAAEDRLGVLLGVSGASVS